MCRFRCVRLIKLPIGSPTYAWVLSQIDEHARYRNTSSASMTNGASSAVGTNQSGNGSNRGVEH